MALKITDKIKAFGLPKQETQPEDVEQARELASSEDDLKERVEHFLTENADKLKKWYSDNQINEKLGKVARKAGATVIYPVLLLYNLLKSPGVHSKDKMMIMASLAYFVLPVDLIPDFILGLGYADDGVAVMTCIKALTSSITPEISGQTRAMCQNLVGEVSEDVIDSVEDAVNEKKQ